MTGLDNADRTICLICRSVLIRSSGYAGDGQWVHESGRNIWGKLHWKQGGSNEYSVPMPMTEGDHARLVKPDG